MLATLGFELAGVAEIDQGIEAGIGQCVHVAATAAIAAVRTTKLFVFLVPERGAAIATVASSDFDRGFINKLHWPLSIPGECPSTQKPAYSGLLWNQERLSALRTNPVRPG